MQSITKRRKVIVDDAANPLLGRQRGTQDELGRRQALSGRVKFLPLAWAGMPKTSFRKNSDSPPLLGEGWMCAVFPGYGSAQRPARF